MTVSIVLTSAQVQSVIAQAGATGPTGGTGTTGGTGATGGTGPFVDLGTMSFDGSQHDSTGMTPGVAALARMVIPNNPGKVFAFQVYEHNSASCWRKMWLSKTPLVTTAPSGYFQQGGGGATMYIAIGSGSFGQPVVQPGEVWYMTIRNQKMDGTSSCTPSLNCNFGYQVSIPS